VLAERNMRDTSLHQSTFTFGNHHQPRLDHYIDIDLYTATAAAADVAYAITH